MTIINLQVPLCQSTAKVRRSTLSSLRLKRLNKGQRLSRPESVIEHVVEEGKSTFYVDNDNSNTGAMTLLNSVEIPSLENSYVSK